MDNTFAPFEWTEEERARLVKGVQVVYFMGPKENPRMGRVCRPYGEFVFIDVPPSEPMFGFGMPVHHQPIAVRLDHCDPSSLPPPPAEEQH